MTKSELWKGVALRSVVALAFAVIGGAAIWYALEMVSIFGEGMGVDDRSRTIYARAHVVVHLFASACALAIGVFVLARSKFLATLAIIAVLTCGSYGILNMVGFTSTNRVSVAAVKDAKKNAAEREYQNARKAIEDQIGWLNKQTVFAENQREKTLMYREIDAKRKELANLKAPVPTADTVLSDPQATTLGEITSLSSRGWALWLPVLLAIFLFYAESGSFVFVGHMISGIIALFVAYNAAHRTTEPPKTQDGSSGSGGSGGGEPRSRPKLVPPEPKPAAARAAPLEPDKVRHAELRVSLGAPAKKLSAFDRAYEAYVAHPNLSTRALAAISGTSQSTSARVTKKQRGKVNSIVRRYGNGGGHIPAYN